MTTTARMAPKPVYDEKHFLERIAHIERNEFVDEKHVSRAADRQPFGDTLHDTKKNYF